MGVSFLKWLRESGDDTPVLIVSALDTAKTAVEALQSGATDYIVKGFDIEELRHRVANILKLTELGAENQRLRRELVADGNFGRMIGGSAAMRRVFEMAERVAPTDTTVLILGESGTGKELLAQEIHDRSTRAGKPFVAINCAALPETLIESELFGYEKGAFTGAAQQRKGKFELASGGTLFLDEIGDMNPVTQAKVLRALESRQIERLGGLHAINVDVRVVSATHRNLQAEIAAGRFREDLYYRIRVVTLELPPLRAHKEDIPLLAADVSRTIRLAASSPGEVESGSDGAASALRVAWKHPRASECAGANARVVGRKRNSRRRPSRGDSSRHGRNRVAGRCGEFIPERIRFSRSQAPIRSCVLQAQTRGAPLERLADRSGSGPASAKFAGKAPRARHSAAGKIASKTFNLFCFFLAVSICGSRMSLT